MWAGIAAGKGGVVASVIGAAPPTIASYAIRPLAGWWCAKAGVRHMANGETSICGWCAIIGAAAGAATAVMAPACRVALGMVIKGVAASIGWVCEDQWAERAEAVGGALVQGAKVARGGKAA